MVWVASFVGLLYWLCGLRSIIHRDHGIYTLTTKNLSYMSEQNVYMQTKAKRTKWEFSMFVWLVRMLVCRCIYYALISWMNVTIVTDLCMWTAVDSLLLSQIVNQKITREQTMHDIRGNAKQLYERKKLIPEWPYEGL